MYRNFNLARDACLFRNNAKIKNSVFVFIMALAVSNISCSKEYSCEDCFNSGNNTNISPVALAGADTMVHFPSDSILLDGRASFDPDGNISRWIWRKIEGPTEFNIADTSSDFTMVYNLMDGNYQFELSVVDNAGAISKDTIKITVGYTGLMVTYNDVHWDWDNQSGCKMIIKNLYPNIPAGSKIEVYFNTIGGVGDDDGWNAIFHRDVNPNPGLFNYEIVGNDLQINSVRIDCNFDDAGSYWIRVIVI